MSPFLMPPAKKSTTQYFVAGILLSDFLPPLLAPAWHWKHSGFVSMFPQLETAGEDKELESLLLKQRIHIEYLEHVHVKDEKTQKKEVIKTSANVGSLPSSIR